MVGRGIDEVGVDDRGEVVIGCGMRIGGGKSKR